MHTRYKTQSYLPLIHAKLEDVLLDKVHIFEKLLRPWVTHYLPPGFDDTLLLP